MGLSQASVMYLACTSNLSDYAIGSIKSCHCRHAMVAIFLCRLMNNKEVDTEVRAG